MAEKQMPAVREQYREINRILDEGVYGTADPQGKLNVFRQYQQAGLLPEGFDDPRALTDYLRSLLEQGKTKKEALEEAKVTLGASFFDKAGSIVGRKIRNDIGPALERAWDLTEPYFSAKDLGALERQGWAENQKELREVGERLGMKLDIGHFDTSASGAPQNIRAAGAEYARANQAAGRSADNPERPITAQERLDLGVASNKVQGLSEAGLYGMGEAARSGTKTPLNPYISVLLGTNLNGESSRLLSGQGLEQLNRTFQDFEDQGLNPVAMYDYLRSKGGEQLTDTDIQEMAKAGEEQYRYSKYNPNRPVEPTPTPAPATPKQPVQQEVMKVIPRGIQQKGGKVKYQRQTVKPQDLSGNQFEMFKKGGGEAALAEGRTLAETIALGRKWTGVKPPASSTKSKPKPKPKPTARRNTIGAAAAGFEGTGINETHPLGGNVVDTDPLGILGGLPIRTP